MKARPAHIGLVVPGFSRGESRSGIPVLDDIVRGLTQNYRVSVFSLRFPPDRGTYQLYGAEIHTLGGEGIRGLSRIPFLVRSLARVIFIARQERVDLLHGFWADEPGFLAGLAGRLLGVPAVVSLMGGELVGIRDISYGGQLGRLNPWLTGAAVRLADELTAGSEIMIDLYGSQYTGRQPIHLPLGVEPASFVSQHWIDPPPVLQGGFHLLSVGSLVPVKDQHSLLQALALVAQQAPDAVLHMVGEGSLRGELERQAADLGLSDRVVFHGHVLREHLPAYYQQAHVFVHSSRFESQAMVLLEAGLSGLPVVSTRVGLIPELETSVLGVPPGDPSALASAILRVRHDPELRTQLGAQLQAKVRSEYALSRTLDRLQVLYESLLSG